MDNFKFEISSFRFHHKKDELKSEIRRRQPNLGELTLYNILR